MGVKEMIQRMGEKNRERKELLKRLDQKTRMEKIVLDRQKSSNERELERYQNEDREEMIKEQLEYARKKRDEDIKFGHQPLNTPNVTNHTDWEVLREPNQFSKKSNMFTNQKSILRSNNNLLRSNKKLLKGRNLFKK